MRIPVGRGALLACLAFGVADVPASGQASPLQSGKDEPNAGALFHLVPDGGLPDQGLTFGGTWADFDDDGLVDLFLSRHGNDDMEILLNRGGLRFAKPDDRPAFPTGILDHHGSAACDFDADGDWDIFLSVGADRGRGLGLKQLWRCDGPLAFVNVVPAGHLLADPPGRGRGALWFDLDGDPHPELLLTNYMSPPRLFSFDGREWSDLGAELALAPVSGEGPSDRENRAPWFGAAAAGDLDGDGRQDLVAAGERLRLYRNLGGSLAEVGAEVGLPASMPSISDIALGDMDGDLDEDVLLLMRGGALWLYLNASEPGTIILTGPVAYPDLPAPKGPIAMTVADLDNDGDLDIAVARSLQSGLGPELILNRGDGTFGAVKQPEAGFLRRPSKAQEIWALDLDRDGDLELVCLNGGGQGRTLPGTTQLYENAAVAGGLTLVLTPRSGPVHALGARVRLEGAARPQHRQMRFAAAPHNSSALPLHFGVGAAPGPFTALIDWPSGARQRVVLPDPGRAYAILEGESTPRPLPAVTRIAPEAPTH